MKLTNEQMQSRFVIHEGRDRDHALRVRATACNAYVTGCRNAQDWPGKVRYNLVVTKNRTTGTTPFSFIANSDRSSERPYSEEWEYQQFTSLGAKIVSISILLSDRTFSPVEEMGSALPFLVVQGAGNERSDEVGFDGSRSSSSWRNLQAAVGANKALIAAGHAPRGTNGSYVRHPASSGCKGVSAGCLWGPFEFPGGIRGTSYTTPAIASALASVLSVFPDTTPTNLAKFAKACAKKSGNGIKRLLAKSGGVGVADFSCMGTVTSALDALPTNGRTSSTVNGTRVSLGSRDLVVSFTNSGIRDTFRDAWTDGFSVVPLYENGDLSVAGIKRKDNLFVSARYGIRDDFYGYTGGHGSVTDTELSAGHRYGYVRVSRQESRSGTLIHEATGYSLGFTAEREIPVTEVTTLTIGAHTDSFLGGDADIPYGHVILTRGGWNHRFSVNGTHRLPAGTVSVGAALSAPDAGENTWTVAARYTRVF